MSRDCAERDELQGVSESLAAEKAGLQRRLQQLREELEADTRGAAAAEAGERRGSAARQGAAIEIPVVLVLLISGAAGCSRCRHYGYVGWIQVHGAQHYNATAQ